MKEPICKKCRWSVYDRSTKKWWCCSDLSEEFDKAVDKEQAACNEYEEEAKCSPV